MSNNPKNNDEEIEIGSLFVILGNGIQRFFTFIGSIFKGLFHFLIKTLLFVKKNSLKLGIAAFIGATIGFVLEVNKDQHYGADMLVQPNFESSRQLYNNVKYYNDLVKQKDIPLLAKTFKISTAEASSLRKFEMFPLKSENDIITAYDNLILEVDTLTAKSYSFEKFKRAFTDFDYKTHQIQVKATDKNVFGSLSGIIISSIVENEYFNKVKNLNNENLNRTDSLLRINLAQTDTLLTVYKNVLLEKAKKENAATNIDLGGKSSSTNELELFNTKRSLNEELKEITRNKSEKSDVINVISKLQSHGYEITGISKNLAFQIAALCVLLMILFLLLLQLNNYLENYKK